MADPMDSERAQPAPARASLAGRVGKDLLPRVLSAIVLAAIAAAALWAGGYAFAALILTIGCIVGWEWGRIVRGGSIDAAMAAHVGVVAGAAILTLAGLIGLGILVLIIGAILVTLLTIGRHPALSATGVLYAGLPTIALLWLRADAAWGLVAVAFLIIAVAAADIGAYFSGRLIGGPKLWPRVSPNKTWAGLVGAMTASALVGAAAGRLLVGGKPLTLAILGAGLAIVAQAGDLAESMLKRRFGVKDASNIIPGHGGFMDRVDGLIPAAIFAALIGAAIDIREPAKALLLSW